MTPIDLALIDSWERNVSILTRLAAVLTPEQLALKSAPGEFDVAEHLCHIHGTRRWWISQIQPDLLAGTEKLHEAQGEDWVPIRDLLLIRERLPQSAGLVVALYKDWAGSGESRRGPYEHPVHFLQHMLWHDGWHVGAILAALRINGQELSEEWEDVNIWGLWRDPETA
jgi:uncharacterized damage-inducible protein DinB